MEGPIMVCPKCGFSGASGTECTECGIIFSKFFAIQKRKEERARKKEEQAAQADEDILDHYYGNIESSKPAVSGWRGYLQQYFWEPYRTPWKPVPTWQMVALSAFFVLFIYSLAKEPWFSLYPDVTKPSNPSIIIKIFSKVTLVFHEGGHAIFSIFGYRPLTVFGGSLTQAFIPFIVSMAFWSRREATGFAFALVWMFQNFLDVGIYMADARHPVLPLIGGINPYDSHDWINLFNWWDLWSYDTFIAKTTWTLGWIGMVWTALWFVWIWFINRSRIDDFKDDFMTGR